MQKKWVLILLFFLVILFYLILFTNQPNSYKSEKMANPLSTASVYSLNKDGISLLEEEVRKGNKDAAFRLYEYYSLVVLDENTAYEWLLKSAQLEHPIAQYNLAIFLLQKERNSDTVYWAKKARDNSVALSDELLILIANEK